MFECVWRRGRSLPATGAHSNMRCGADTRYQSCGCPSESVRRPGRAFDCVRDADARYQFLWVHVRCVRRSGHPLPVVPGARSNGVRLPGRQLTDRRPLPATSGMVKYMQPTCRMALRKAAGLEVLVWVTLVLLAILYQ